MQKKTCKACSEKFTPVRSFQKVCDKESCAIKFAQEHFKKEKEKKGRKALRAFRKSDIAELKRKTQTLFNKFIRLRDAHLPCISCGHNFNGPKSRQRHAGHYRPQGGNSLLRYDERNCHAQCSICNNYKSGNLADYRIGLIKKIGLAAVEEIEAMETLKKWTEEELNSIIYNYKQKIKEYENDK